jgi:aminoglycoside/choline kinase family phosphotransferase
LDKRLSALTRWINACFNSDVQNLRPASTDASFRRYFRFDHSGQSYIVMDAPPEYENMEIYISTARRFMDIGLNVPKIIDQNRDQGFLLISDLGRTTYLDHLNAHNVDRLYGDALGALIVLQTGTMIDPRGFPRYDRTLLLSEMALFREWYADKHFSYPLQPEQLDIIENTFAILCESALEQPQVWVHRDYHSRNLMVTASNNPGILDFQDAVTGPITYDLVSLLRDCYIEWPPSQVREWALGYQNLAIQSGLLLSDDEDQFIEWFDYMGVQRHIKVLGIFARLYHRDGKSDYLNDLPLVWKYAMTVCRNYPDLQPFAELLQELQPLPCTP